MSRTSETRAGRELDATGLDFYRARYYSPTLQRFVSEDPLEYAAGDANLYLYVSDSPLNWTDPLGADKKKNCPAVPDHPPSADVDKNVADAHGNRWLLYMFPLGAPIAGGWFYQQVRNKGPWDYKQSTTMNDFGVPNFPSPYEDLGNFNYGATGAALGLPLDALLIGGGLAATRSHPETSGTTWDRLFDLAAADDLTDQVQILQGYQYYKSGCHQ